MLCVTKAYALLDMDVIIHDFLFKSATLELIEVLPAEEKTLLPGKNPFLPGTKNGLLLDTNRLESRFAC